MKIQCEIIRDILPLYAEDMVSQPTRAMVEEHLGECEGCTRELEIIKKNIQVPVEMETGSLKRIGDSIRKRRILAVLAAVMTVLSIVIVIVTYMFTPYYLTAEDAIEGVELREDGALAIDYARGVNGTAGYGYLDEENWGILCHTTRYDWYVGKNRDRQLQGMTEDEIKAYIAEQYDLEECTQRVWDRFFNIDVDHGVIRKDNGAIIPGDVADRYMDENIGWVYRPAEENHWYINPSTGEAETLLWDAGQDYPESILVETTPEYAVAFYGCIILAAILYFVSRRINGIGRELAIRGVIICCGAAVSALNVTGGDLTAVHLYGWKEMFAVNTVFISMSCLLWHLSYRNSKMDKLR